MNQDLQQNVAVAVYKNPASAESVVRGLQAGRFKMTRLSLVSLDTAQHLVLGCYRDGEKLKCWGSLAGFWEGIWELLDGGGLFAIPDFGRVLVAGPLAGWIVAALENASIFAGLTAVGSALYSIGIPQSRVEEYETALKAGALLLVVYGSASEVQHVSRLLAEPEGHGSAREERPEKHR